MTGNRISAPQLIIVMGVSAAGKTVVGRALAAALSWRFLDADEFHSAANKEKMHRGEGLTDGDRAPWLTKLRDVNTETVQQGPPTVLACSALKQAYRDELVPIESAPGVVRFVYLDVPVEVLRQRLASRQHHFAPPELLDSQLATLEKPHGALWVDGTKPIDEIVRLVREALAV